MSESRIFARIAKEFEWEEYVDQHFIPKIAAGKRGVELRIDCPSCGALKKKCYVNPELGLFNCYKCDFSSRYCDVFDFVAKTEGIPRGLAIRKLIRQYKEVTPDDDNVLYEVLEDNVLSSETGLDRASIRTISSLPKEAIRLTKALQPRSRPFWEYLIKERGLTVSEVLSMQTHFVPGTTVPVYNESDKYVGNLGRRVLWPIFGGTQPSLVGWQARKIDKVRNQKYLNNPHSDMAKTVWPYVRPKTKSVILVEGIMDAMAVRRATEESVYATFSKQISREQISLLRTWGVNKVNLLWDKEAKKSMVTAAADLTTYFSVSVFDLSTWDDDLDPGECLSLPTGTSILKETLSKRINVQDLEFVRWQIQ